MECGVRKPKVAGRRGRQCGVRIVLPLHLAGFGWGGMGAGDARVCRGIACLCPPQQECLQTVAGIDKLCPYAYPQAKSLQEKLPSIHTPHCSLHCSSPLGEEQWRELPFCKEKRKEKWVQYSKKIHEGLSRSQMSEFWACLSNIQYISTLC